MIVCANSEAEAIKINPTEDVMVDDEGRFYTIFKGSIHYNFYRNWASNCNNVSCELIGEALDSVPLGVVLKSFNAG